jgi:hypothetical protein
LIVKRQIFLRDNQATNAFLTVSRRELIAQLWPSRLPDQCLNESVIVLRLANHDLIDVPWYGRFIGHRRITVLHAKRCTGESIV